MIPSIGKLKVRRTTRFFGGDGLHCGIVSSIFSGSIGPNTVIRLIPVTNSGIGRKHVIFIAMGTLASRVTAVPRIRSLSFQRTCTVLHTHKFRGVRVRCIPNSFGSLTLNIRLRKHILRGNRRMPLATPLILGIDDKSTRVPISSLKLPSSDIPIRSLSDRRRG